MPDRIISESFDVGYAAPVTKKGKTVQMRREMLKYFGSVVAVSFLTIVLALVVAVVLTNEEVKNSSSSELELQIENQAQSTLQEAGTFVTQILNNVEESVATVISKTTTNQFRDDYSMSLSAPSYLDYNDAMLAHPLAEDERHHENVSFSHSSYKITNVPAPHITGYNNSAVIDNIINRTTHLDTFFEHAYSSNIEVVVAYVGFDTSPSLFRRYPGMNTLDLDTGRTYDPVLRPWYIAALESRPGATFSSPYPDAFEIGMMITCSQLVHNQDGSLLGVVGVDVLISSIDTILERVKFLDTGKISLFEDNGLVVSDKEWTAIRLSDNDQFDDGIFKYSDLQSPAVPENIWNRIIDVDVGSTRSTKFGEYVAYSNRLPAYNYKYIVVVFVLQSEIFAALEDPINDLDKASEDITVFLVVVTTTVFVCLMLLILLIVNSILQTFENIEKNVDVLLRNVGCFDRSLTDGMVDSSHALSGELITMNENIDVVIRNLTHIREKKGAELAVFNPAHDKRLFFQGLLPFTHEQCAPEPELDYSFASNSVLTSEKE